MAACGDDMPRVQFIKKYFWCEINVYFELKKKNMLNTHNII